ncbi:MAG: MarR family transcriptional regulator [Nanoarchaeota archaeon]
MENKKLGVLMIIISLVFGFFLIYYNFSMDKQSVELGCNSVEGCQEIKEVLSVTHMAFGFFGFMLALGFYLLFFNKTEERILKRLEDQKNVQLEEEKFSIILKALDEYEKRVLYLVKEQEGITQNTLRLRANMSKAKLSYVLQELEKRQLIKRIPKGKTLEIHLKI